MGGVLRGVARLSLLTGIFVQKDLLLVARALGMEPFVELSRSGSLETSLQAS